MKFKSIFLTLFFLLTVSLATMAQDSQLDVIKQNAETALQNKQFVRARDNYLRLFTAYSNQGDYATAVDYGLKANEINIQERAFKEAFDLFRNIGQVITDAEKKTGKQQPQLSYNLASERLLLYQKMRRDSLASWQLQQMDRFAKAINTPAIYKNLLVLKMSNSFVFGRYAQGEAYLKELAQMQGDGSREEMNSYYQQLFAVARQSNNAAFTELLYNQYNAWNDSLNLAIAEAKYQQLQTEYNEVKTALADEEDTVRTKQWFIVILCIVLGAAIVFIFILILRQISLTMKARKAKRLMLAADERNERHSSFVQNVSAQILPAIGEIEKSATQLPQTMPQTILIQDTASALQSYMQHIERLSQLESSLTELYPTETIGLKDFFDELDAIVRPTIAPGVNLVMDTPKMQVTSNRDQLKELLLHLLGNAAKFTKEGNIRLEYKKRGAQTFQFVVTDNGPGIPEEEQQDIFKPFSHVNQGILNGDGLGLPICSLMAVKLNGQLTIDSTYKRGCRFILELHS